MPLPFNRLTARILPTTPRTLHDKLVSLLEQSAADWTEERLRHYLTTNTLPDDYLWTTARFVRGRPDLWFVSDDEFIGAVMVLNPACAALLATPKGLDYLHRLSTELAVRGTQLLFGLGPKEAV